MYTPPTSILNSQEPSVDALERTELDEREDGQIEVLQRSSNQVELAGSDKLKKVYQIDV